VITEILAVDQGPCPMDVPAGAEADCPAAVAELGLRPVESKHLAGSAGSWEAVNDLVVQATAKRSGGALTDRGASIHCL